jgi:hypothetical protein
MSFALGIASSLQVVTGTLDGSTAKPAGLLGCLGSLLVFSLLSILSFSILKVRSFLNRSGKEKPDFPSLRSTGKTIVNASPPDDDDPDQFGSVN